MKKENKKKGFTLVELLVVIAILAILASVSVVGYLSFTKKAKISNAETEMAQIREVIRGHLLDGSEICINTGVSSGLTLYINDGKVDTKACDETEHTHSTNNLSQTFEDLASFENLTLNENSIVYTNGDVTATWTLSTDIISAEVA